MAIRVLIVEDESLIRWSLRQKFEQMGYQVTEAERGDTALDELGTEVYDLVMLDYRLPDMTGLDILRQLRQTDQDRAGHPAQASRHGSGRGGYHDDRLQQDRERGGGHQAGGV